ncbi:MAG TPA: ABC transporter permease [Capsulimonadaceae bacterium]|jgi:simple sugar transport system permease protein
MPDTQTTQEKPRLSVRLVSYARTAAPYIIAAVVTVIVMVIVIAAGHGNVREALTAMWDGAVGVHFIVKPIPLPGGHFSLVAPVGISFDRSAIGTTLVRTGPLVLTGLGVAIAFRARMWNIGGQGQFLLGAILASVVATRTGFSHFPTVVLIPMMLTASILAGAIWAALPAVLKTWRSVPEVISTIMLNFVALFLLSYLVNGPLQRSDHSQPATEQLSTNATLPVLVSGTSLHAGLFVVAIAAVLAWAMLTWSRTGFSIKVVGASPGAARLYGHNVVWTTIAAMAWSGALCGLAGGIELSGVLGNLPEGYAPDFGFTAVAVALLGRLQVRGVVLSALLFGALAAGSENMERTAGIAHELGFVVQACLLLTLLAAPAFAKLRTVAAPALPSEA